MPARRILPRSMMTAPVQISASSVRMCELMRMALPCAGQHLEQLAQLDAGPRVEAGGRLVHDEHRRVVDQGAGRR